MMRLTLEHDRSPSVLHGLVQVSVSTKRESGTPGTIWPTAFI